MATVGSSAELAAVVMAVVEVAMAAGMASGLRVEGAMMGVERAAVVGRGATPSRVGLARAPRLSRE